MSEQRKASYINSTQQLISKYILDTYGTLSYHRGKNSFQTFPHVFADWDVEIKSYVVFFILFQSRQHCTHCGHVNKRHHIYFTTWHMFTSMCMRTPTHTHLHSPPPHLKLAIIFNPSPAWVIPDNPRLILVNSGHSSAGFHPETTETGWGLVGSWRLRLGAALMDIIGRAVIGSQEKQAQVFTVLQKYVRIDPGYVTLQPYCCRRSW